MTTTPLTPEAVASLTDAELSEAVAPRICACGCGLPTTAITRNNRRFGYVKGEYYKFLQGHYSRTEKHKTLMDGIQGKIRRYKGEGSPCWKGGRAAHSAGYVVVRRECKYVLEHRAVAEEMIGRKLRAEEVVHHINGDRADNRPENLQVLASQADHVRLHTRERKERSAAALLAAQELEK